MPSRKLVVRSIAAGCCAVAAIAAPSTLAGRNSESRAASPLKLVWSDEFNGAKGTQPNPKAWNYEVGGKGWATTSCSATPRPPATCRWTARAAW